MPVKVKRGLGLLVIAAIAAFVYLAFRSDPGVAGGAEATAANVSRLIAGWCALIGLVLVAWGLLRD